LEKLIDLYPKLFPQPGYHVLANDLWSLVVLIIPDLKPTGPKPHILCPLLSRKASWPIILSSLEKKITRLNFLTGV
ncbi:MAG: hypothetical protein ACPLRR_07695, partial [Candidatus Saccharicenans sp.]